MVRGLGYKTGEPVTMMINKAPPSSTTTAQKPPNPPKRPVQKEGTGSASSTSGDSDKGKASTTTATTTKKATPPPVVEKKKAADGMEVPQYTITERGRVEISDHMAADDSRTRERPTSTRPKELVIRIELPFVVSPPSSTLVLRGIGSRPFSYHLYTRSLVAESDPYDGAICDDLNRRVPQSWTWICQRRGCCSPALGGIRWT